MPIDSDKMTRILHNFVSKISDVEGAAVVTPDGLPLASSLPGGIDDVRVSAKKCQLRCCLWARKLELNLLKAAWIKSALPVVKGLAF